MDFSKQFKKDEFSGKKCFIVGSGPSLANKDLSLLKDFVIIALNLSILTLDLNGIKPNFNIIADKYQYPRFSEVYRKLTYNKDVKKIIVASACDTFPRELIDKDTFFFPKKLQQKIPTFSTNPLKEGFSRGKTVAYDAIQLAYYLGFDEVNTIGVDMDFNKKWGVNGHSYEIEKNPKFSNLEFAKRDDFEIQRGSPGHPEFEPYIKKCMKLAKKAFQEKGRKIFNDSSSKLDIFPKKNFFEKQDIIESKLKKEISKYDFLFSKDKRYNSNPNHKRFSVAKEFLSSINVEKVLDVGVGRGHFFRDLDKLGYAMKGIEPSLEARKLLKDKRIINACSHKIPFKKNEFDIVICLDVLEHVPKELITKSLEEIKRVSKRYALISVAHHSDVKRGWELHISSMPFKEWRELIKNYFSIIKSKIVSSKSDKSKVSELYLLNIKR
jgi:ubiquinone/menaquinone biosynthesis C-methylase UbiE